MAVGGGSPATPGMWVLIRTTRCGWMKNICGEIGDFIRALSGVLRRKELSREEDKRLEGPVKAGRERVSLRS